MKAANVTVEPFWPGLFAKCLESVNIKDLVANVGSGAGAAPAAAAAGGAAPAAAAAVEEVIYFLFQCLFLGTILAKRLNKFKIPSKKQVCRTDTNGRTSVHSFPRRSTLKKLTLKNIHRCVNLALLSL